jgi:hypothetical protein
VVAARCVIELDNSMSVAALAIRAASVWLSRQDVEVVLGDLGVAGH